MKTVLPQFLVTLSFFFTFSSSKQETSSTYCGKIEIQTPFYNPNSSSVSSISSPAIGHMITCKSDKPYFRTSIGLFHVSSIDYDTKTITVSHFSCSSSRNYISPSLLTSGFPSPPQPNSVLLFNCLNNRNYTPNCMSFDSCVDSSHKIAYKCLLIDDLDKLVEGFQLDDLNCSHYQRVYRKSSKKEDDYGGVELGTRVSFDIPDHVPDICNECRKPNGNCGVGLRCLCHAKECKDRVINKGGKLQAFGRMFFSVLASIVLVLVS